MTAWSHYAKCWECGAEASHHCVGDDGKEAVEVCDGRRLVIRDAPGYLARTRDTRRLGTSERATRRRQAHPPSYAPCAHCGVEVRLWGTGVATGRGWCEAPACRLAQRRDKEARRKAALPPPPPKPPKPVIPVIPTLCFWCAREIPKASRRPNATMPCCGDLSCRRARSRIWAQRRRSGSATR